jgi:hypothetical protein
MSKDSAAVEIRCNLLLLSVLIRFGTGSVNCHFVHVVYLRVRVLQSLVSSCSKFIQLGNVGITVIEQKILRNGIYILKIYYESLGYTTSLKYDTVEKNMGDFETEQLMREATSIAGKVASSLMQREVWAVILRV